MIEVSHIRIGNLYHNHRRWVCPVVGFDEDSVTVIAGHYGKETFKLEDMHPITLTPEFLLSNGFHKIEDLDVYTWNRKCGDGFISIDISDLLDGKWNIEIKNLSIYQDEPSLNNGSNHYAYNVFLTVDMFQNILSDCGVNFNFEYKKEY